MNITAVYDAFISTTSSLLKLEKTSMFIEDFNNQKEEFLKSLNEQQVDVFNELIRLLDAHYDAIYFDYCNKACNFGIKSGIEIQQNLEILKEY